MKKRPEILAPCGNMDALRAAVAAGADACYLAGNSFGARAYAANFSDSELLEAIDFAHLHSTKIYLTVNTLVKNEELKYVYDMLIPLYRNGLDAAIVQDFGIFKMLRECFPDLDIHTSTQMNITGVSGAKLFKRLGATRVVAAREMTIEELAAIRKEADIEVEAFVHGAMCLCYSGRCLMSSMAGGRSGNRGRCAQPCRRIYNGSYKLSMRDMCTLRYIPELVEAGIDSFKIEGRMKNEYYVAVTVDAYKELTNAYLSGDFTKELAEKYEFRLLDTFNRGGFTTGYLKRSRNDKVWDSALIDDTMPGRRGVKVGVIDAVKDGKVHFKALYDINSGDELLVDDKKSVSLTVGKDISSGENAALKCPETGRLKKGTAIYRTRNKTLQTELDELINSPEKIPLMGEVHIKNGEPMSLKLSGTNICSEGVTVEASAPDKADLKPTDDATIKDKLSQMGGTDFVLKELIIDNDNESFVPIRTLKELRRNGIQKIKEVSCASSYRGEPREYDPFYFASNGAVNSLNRQKTSGSVNIPDNQSVHISVSSKEQLEAVLSSGTKIDYLYIDMSFGDDVENMVSRVRQLKDGGGIKLILALPFICRGEYDISSPGFEKLMDGFDGIYVRCIDDVSRLILMNENLVGKSVILANSIYAYNDMAVRFIEELFSDIDCRLIFETPFELTYKDIEGIGYSSTEKTAETVMPYYGRIPLMVTAALRDTAGILKDEMNHSFYVKSSGDLCYNVILGDVPLSLHNYKSEIKRRLYAFTIESPDEVRDVLSDDPAYIKTRKYTKGHFEKGI